LGDNKPYINRIALFFMGMRLRLQAKLRKAIRRAEYRHIGLRAAIARYERHGRSFSRELWRFVMDCNQNWWHRKTVSSLVWETRGAEHLRIAMTNFAVATSEVQPKTEYLRLSPYQRQISSADLTLLRQIMQAGTPEDQITAIDELAFLSGGSVRRSLIGIMNDASAPLQVRERAVEMSHLQMCTDTVEACERLVEDPSPTIRFWVAYALGQDPKAGARTRAAAVLERLLNDAAVAPGWWSVRREAQASIVGLRDDPSEEAQLQREIGRISEDPNASAEDRRWADCYRRESGARSPADALDL
jgi:hypothetical protein